MTTFAVRTVSALAAVFATTVSIAAASPVEAATRQVRVDYGDLDLASLAGTAMLEARINTAARRVCRSVDRTTLAEFSRCYSSARKDALAKMPVRLAANEDVDAGAGR